MIKRCFGPGSICFEQRICEDDDFSHDGGNCDLGGFSGGDEGLIFGLHIGIISGGDEGWHVECLPEDRAVAADVATATMLSAVAGDGGRPARLSRGDRQACSRFLGAVRSLTKASRAVEFLLLVNGLSGDGRTGGVSSAPMWAAADRS